MDSLINSIGGYESWQFAALTFGSLFIGGGIYIVYRYFIPLPIFGIILFYEYLYHLLESSRSNLSPMAVGFSTTIPIIIVAALSLVLVSCWERKPTQKSKDKEMKE